MPGLGELKEHFGLPSFLLLTLSFIIFPFYIYMPPQTPPSISSALLLSTLFFLISGIFFGFNHFINKQYQLNFKDYFVRGMFAGVFSGLIGGLLYAYLIETKDLDGFSYAVARVFITSVIIGGFYGSVLGIFQPGDNFAWKRRFIACFVLSLIIILTLVGLAILTGDEWKNSEKIYGDCFIILIIIGIYISIMAGLEIKNQNNQNLPIAIKKHLFLLIIYLITSAGVVLGALSWIFGVNLFVFKFSPENFWSGMGIGMLLYIWSGFGYLLVTPKNPIRNKLDRFLP